jgi:beta-phosphoglucomutase family hydrolase
MAVKAFLFDLNGTMIDDMEFHLKIWYDVLNNDLGANLSWEEVRRNMYGKNDELLARVFGEGKFSAEEVAEISQRKEERYQQAYKPHLDLLPGLFEFLESAHRAGIQMAIGSAAIPYNINFVLDNLNIRQYFKAIVSAHDVLQSKPHPEVFLKAAEQLKALPSDCIVFEDAPKGVEAAQNAGMKSVVITSMHRPEEFAQYKNVLLYIADYSDPQLKAVTGLLTK